MRLLSSLIAALLFASSAAAELRGVYNGIEAASGMRLEFSPGEERMEGVFFDRTGESRPFDADTLETGAETVMERDGQKVYMLFNEEPLGLTLIAIPMTEEDELMTQRTEALVFIKEGVQAPPRPARYVPPPAGPGGTMDPRAFVESYPFWPSVNVGYGYEMVRGRYRTLIRLHPLVQADMLWKMCRSQTSPAGLGEALRGQGVNCNDVLAAFARIMAPGRAVQNYNRYRREVEAEREALVTAIVCSIDYRRNDPECMAAGKEVSRRAVSLETVKTVLSRY